MTSPSAKVSRLMTRSMDRPRAPGQPRAGGHAAWACPSEPMSRSRATSRFQLRTRELFAPRLVVESNGAAPAAPSNATRRGTRCDGRTTAIARADARGTWHSPCCGYRTKGGPMTDPRKHESGRIGYLVLYLMGVPIGVLLLLYLVAGNNI